MANTRYESQVVTNYIASLLICVYTFTLPPKFCLFLLSDSLIPLKDCSLRLGKLSNINVPDE